LALRNGGVYYTASGDPVRVYTSPRYVFDPAVNQGYADFLGELVHGTELRSLTVYIAPLAEMQRVCSPEADACYGNGLLVTTGDTPPDGTPLEEIAAHEYGHHVASHRLNDLGSAVAWGPEYWATHEDICNREANGTAFPGDEGSNYSLNPGEAWAETYRVLNGGSAPWDRIDPSFYPDGGALRAARRDVLQPFQGDEYTDRTGRFRVHSSRWRQFVVPVQNDGTVDLRLRSTGSLDADLYVYRARTASRSLRRSTRGGRTEHLAGTFCGYRRLVIGVYRYRGAGSFRLRASLPYNTR
jgi:hypothetical protein